MDWILLLDAASRTSFLSYSAYIHQAESTTFLWWKISVPYLRIWIDWHTCFRTNRAPITTNKEISMWTAHLLLLWHDQQQLQLSLQRSCVHKSSKCMGHLEVISVPRFRPISQPPKRWPNYKNILQPITVTRLFLLAWPNLIVCSSYKFWLLMIVSWEKGNNF